MLNDILFITFIFVTRIGLPIIATFIVGALIERALQHGTRSQTRRVWKLTERHAG